MNRDPDIAFVASFLENVKKIAALFPPTFIFVYCTV